MKRVLSLIVLLALLTACAANGGSTPPVPALDETTDYVTPAPLTSPSEESVVSVPTPTPMPEPTAEPIPAGVSELLTNFYDHITAGDFGDIPGMLTIPYLFDYDKTATLRGTALLGYAEVVSGISEENYLSALRRSAYTVNEITSLNEGVWLTTVTSQIPDFMAMYSAFYDAHTNSDGTMDESAYSNTERDDATDRAIYTNDPANIYYAEQLAAQFPVKTFETTVTVIERDGGFKIQTDENLLNSVAQKLRMPFATQAALSGEEIYSSPYAERRSYIENHLTVERSDDTLLITNNGDKDVAGLTLTHLVRDKNGDLLAQYFDSCFVPRGGFAYLEAKNYNLRPGYQFETYVASRYRELIKGVSKELSETFISDVWITDDVPIAVSESVTDFGEDNISVDKFDVSVSRTQFGYADEQSIVNIKVTNRSADKTITALTLRAIFTDDDGVVRSETVFNLLDESESIEPGKTYTLGGEYFFSAFGTPRYLVKENCEITPINVQQK